MDEQELNSLLVDTVPELGAAYERLMAGATEPYGPHVVYGDVLNPLLEELLSRSQSTPQDEELLRRIFDLLERVAGDPDEDAVNVVAVTVGEALHDDRQRLTRAREYMGPATLDLLRDSLPWRYPRRLRNRTPRV